MSFPLAKLITSGILGLNTSGLALYFGPQLFEGASTSPLFDSLTSNHFASETRTLKKFIDGEKLIIEKLNAEISKFIETLKALTTEKTQEYSKIREFFEKVSSTEQELKTFYDSNREILEEIGKLGKYEHDVSAKKLEAEESAKRLEFLKESLKKVSGVMHGWGVSVQELICALENAAENNCRSKANSWFSSNSSGSTSNLTGGGADSSNPGTGSDQAKKQLKDSKEELERELQKLKSEFWTNLMSLWARTHEKEIVDTFKSRIEAALAQLKQQLNTQKNKLDSGERQAQSKTEELNKFYSNLNDSYRKWEGIKMLERSISQYKGVLENYSKKSLLSEGDSFLGR